MKNSINEPICIAELQLVWYDASSDSKLASARLYFRPEDTPIGRLPNHGQDELLYADQKVVIKCHDMAIWEDSGIQWNCGMVPLFESDFVCIDDRYHLNSTYVSKEKERLRCAKKAWQSGEKPRQLKILTLPAYCRYRALKKRLLSGACLSRAQLLALGGVQGDESTSTRVLFCRDSFRHPCLDKFELSGDNKAPVLKGRPRKKRKSSAPQNCVAKKKRLVSEIENHIDSFSSAKRSKLSEGDESASSDISEGVMERSRVPSNTAKAAPSIDPLPSINPKVQAISNIVPMTPLAHPPPLISAKSNKGTQHLRQEQNKMTECSRTIPMQKLVVCSKESRKDDKVGKNADSVLLNGTAKAESLHTREKNDLLSKSSTFLESQSDSNLRSSLEVVHPQNVENAGTSNQSKELAKTIVTNLADESSFSRSSRPVATTQGTFGPQVEVSTGPVVRIQPVASLAQPVVSSRAVLPRLHQPERPLPLTVSSGIKTTNVAVTVSSGNSSVTADSSLHVKSKPSLENEERLPVFVSNKKKENKVDKTEEAIAWKKKKKRLRMPGSVKDEIYDDEDEKYFMQTLQDFMKKTNQPLGKLPALGFKKVNLWTMYKTAQRFGGYDAVTSKRLWRRVYDSLGGSTTITSAATYTRRHYERLLLPYERFIRSQLKKQVDEKMRPVVSEPAPKETPSKSDKKQALAVANSMSKHKSCTNPDGSKAVDLKKDSMIKESTHSKVPQVAVPVSSPQTLPRPASVASSSEKSVAKKINSRHTPQSVTLVTGKAEQTLPTGTVSSTNQEYEESKLFSKNVAEMSQSSVVTHLQIHKPVGQQNKQHNLNEFTDDDQTSARTNTIYAKNTTGTNSKSRESDQAGCLQRVARVVREIAPKPPSPQQSFSETKGREVIDLTSDDSPPQSQSKSYAVCLVQGPQQNAEMSKMQGTKGKESEISKMPRTKTKDSNARRIAPKPQFKRESDCASRHGSIVDTHPRIEMTPLTDSNIYSVEPQGKQALKVSSHLPLSSSGSTVKKNFDEMYVSVKQEIGVPKHKKKLHQSKVEGTMSRFTQSPSGESADEHFAEWKRRQANVPQLTKSPVSQQRHTAPCNLEQEKLDYYVPENTCPPDCPCSLPMRRKSENLLLPLPKPKKEHYEEDLPFASMTWAPSSVGPGHPDHYMYSHPAHLPPPTDSLASHVYSASRIFIPSAQIFSPPYPLGMTPIGAPPLLAGAEDQIHIHPHCLMASTYPSSSSSRTPDGAAYPLYSFT